MLQLKKEKLISLQNNNKNDKKWQLKCPNQKLPFMFIE
jgi:hypothetical protein